MKIYVHKCRALSHAFRGFTSRSIQCMLYLLTGVFFSSMAYGQQFHQPRSGGGTGFDISTDLATDSRGNKYATGYFENTINFGNGVSLSSAGAHDYYLVKYDCSNQPVWAYAIGSSLDDKTPWNNSGVCVDAAGNVYVTGSVNKSVSVTFNGAAGSSVTLAGAMGLFAEIMIASYTSEGVLRWTFTAGGKDPVVDVDGGLDVVTDGQNVYATGQFVADTLHFDSFTVVNGGGSDIFIASLTCVSGDVNWLNTASGTSLDVGTELEIGESGYLYTSGACSFHGNTATFGSISGHASGGWWSSYVAKVNRNTGAWVWVNDQVTNSYTPPTSVNAMISFDPATETLYSGGNFEGSVTFYDQVTSKVKSSFASTNDIYLSAFDKNGYFVWNWSSSSQVADFGNSGQETIYCMTSDAGSLWLTGGVSGSATFGSYSLSASGGTDILLLQTDKTANTMFAGLAGGSGNEYGTAVHIDHLGNTQMVGFFTSNPASFGSQNIYSAGGTDMFISSFGNNGNVCCITGNVKIEPARTISGSEAWTGKVYVSGNIIVQDGAVLDISTADVIFAPCTGIEFNDGSRLVAHNSVFRTCGDSDVWRGFKFNTSTNNLVSECTFKNAQNALWITQYSGVRIINNQFYNCRHGVVTYELDQNYGTSISGNTFLIDDPKGNYGQDNCDVFTPFYANDHYGIYMVNSVIEDAISQNDFISTVKNPAKNFYGIYTTSGANARLVSFNKFTNNTRSICVNGSTNNAFSIENNTIEVSNRKLINDYQIALISVSSAAQVFNNKISNMNEYSEGSMDNAAIYAEGSSYLNIKHNTIHGFKAGMNLQWIGSSQITENILENTFYYAIYMEGGVNNDISCNEIDLDFRDKTPKIGIGVITYLSEMGAGINIFSNCIKDTRTAIYLVNSFGNSMLPYLRNNYLYNYTDNGIYVQNQVGNIGSPGDPGMNTLYSNTGATDIFSIPNVITAADNYGMMNLVNVAVTSNNNIHSTASCGHQISGLPSQGWLNRTLICDDYEESILPLVPGGGLKYALAGDYEGLLDKMPGAVAYERLLLAINTLDEQDLPAIMQYSVRSEKLNAEQKIRIQLAYQLRSNRVSDAMATISAIQAKDEHEAVYLQALRIMLTYRNSAQDQNALNTCAEQLQTLYGQAAEAHKYLADMQLELLGKKVFHFQPVKLPEMSVASSTDRLLLTQDYMEVYPNPGKDLVNIRFNISGVADDSRIEVLDITGRVLQSKALGLNADICSLDVSALAEGVYIISLKTGTELKQQMKFVKQ